MFNAIMFIVMIMFGCGDKDDGVMDSGDSGCIDADTDGWCDTVDCNDADAAINPGAMEIACNNTNDDCDPTTKDHPDNDGDGYNACTDLSLFPMGGDCDDTVNTIHPDAPELCNGTDDDCDTLIDEDQDGNTGTESWYNDADGDGFGDSFVSYVCDGAHPSWVNDGSDCDDTLAYAYPGAAEIESATDCMEDEDEDGWGNEFPTGTATAGTDCADDRFACYPGAAYNESATACMRDGDLDGWGNSHPTDPNITVGADCDDALAYAYPGAAELDSTTSCMEDEDEDGYGDDLPDDPIYTSSGTDCDDENSDFNTDATMDTCDVGDDDCDGTIDEDCADCALEVMGEWSTVVKTNTLPNGLADSENNCSLWEWRSDCGSPSGFYDEWCNHITGVETTALSYDILIDGFLESDPRVGIGFLECNGNFTKAGSSGGSYNCEDYMYDDLIVLTLYDPSASPELVVEVRRLSDIGATVMVWNGFLSSTATEWSVTYDSGKSYGLFDSSKFSTVSDTCGIFIEVGSFDLEKSYESYNDGGWGSDMISYWSGTNAETVYGPDFIKECSDMYAMNFDSSQSSNGYGDPPKFHPNVSPLFMKDFFDGAGILSELDEESQEELIDLLVASPGFQQNSQDPVLKELQIRQMTELYNNNDDYVEMMIQIELDWEDGICSDSEAWWLVRRGSWFHGVGSDLWYTGPSGQ